MVNVPLFTALLDNAITFVFVYPMIC